MYTVAHLSDLHIPPLPSLGLRDLASKRLLGLFSWHHKWKREHRLEILANLRQRLATLKPDHICVTGDLTFTTHRKEVDQARRWLEALGPTRRLSLVPGNHDAYVAGALDYAREQWAPWMRDDDSGQQTFPYLHRRGPIDIIGLSSAIAVRTPRSIGHVDGDQIARLEQLINKRGDDRRPRFLLLHHPPHDGATRPAKELIDRAPLQNLIERLGVDLILHGHLHKPVRTTLKGPRGPIPVFGTASASARGQRYQPAHFHLFHVESQNGRMHCRVQHAHYHPDRETFELQPARPVDQSV
jgi:3',5'-cyclic AMP phosphodiesterase CpdA